MRETRAEVRRHRVANEALRREIGYLQAASSGRRWQVVTVDVDQAPDKLNRVLRQRDWQFEELAVTQDQTQLSFLLFKPPPSTTTETKNINMKESTVGPVVPNVANVEECRATIAKSLCTSGSEVDTSRRASVGAVDSSMGAASERTATSVDDAGKHLMHPLQQTTT
jgi:hypothetical protein